MQVNIVWILCLWSIRQSLAQDSIFNGQAKRQIVFRSPEYYKNPCNYTAPPKPKFSKPNVRLSVNKCQEHMWELRQIEENQIQDDDCWTWKVNNLSGYGTSSGVGGRNTEPGEFPHMGALGWRATVGTWIFKCGSSLISSKFLITAAHCSKVPARDTTVKNRVPEIVRLGDKNIADVRVNFLDPVDVNIKRIISHPKFDPPRKYFDIALVELMNEVQFSKMIQPACLWVEPDVKKLGKEPTITGWGVTETAGKTSSPELQAVTLDFIDSDYCDRLLFHYRDRNWLTGLDRHQLCAGKLAGGADACQGDSGGPLQVSIKFPKNDLLRGLHYLVGVTSFGVRCALMNLPGVYTRISSFADWIEGIVWRGL